MVEVERGCKYPRSYWHLNHFNEPLHLSLSPHPTLFYAEESAILELESVEQLALHKAER